MHMQRSENIGQLVAALAVAQAKFRAVTKDRNASIQSKTGGSFRYAYADLATGIAAVKDALSANGLAVVQPARLGEGSITVTTLLAHSSGEWISEEMSWPVAATDNRSIGSGITYARRHSLLAMVGAAATDEDDDAESARGGDHDTAKPAPKPPAKPHAPPEAEPPQTPARILWAKAKDKWGKEAATHYAAAVKSVGIPQETPSDSWTMEQVQQVEAALFPKVVPQQGGSLL
jgi:hypothetical protein